MNEKLKVLIQAEQKVSYWQVVEMTQAEYKKCVKALENEDHGEIAGWVDTHDIDDAEPMEIINIVLQKAGKRGEA
jgi:hypothetical protein